jgi:hypothetical protein
MVQALVELMVDWEAAGLSGKTKVTARVGGGASVELAATHARPA